MLPYESTKRVLDVTVAGLGLAVLSPVMAIIAAAVKLTSPGPVIYQGKRSGLEGTTFLMYKFRSMAVGSDAGAMTTSRQDPRVTAVGRVLRRYKLDELPQLVNVLRGEMSLVGPRPELPHYTNQYSHEERAILSVKPGITDFSSIEFSDLSERIDDDDPNGAFETLVLDRKNELRLAYVEQRSLAVDLRILGTTLARLVRRGG